MPLRFMLDTNIVSYHIRESSAALRRRLRRVPAADVALSVVTEMEIRYGLARNPRLKAAPLISAFLDGITILPMTSDVARTYAVTRAALEKKGTPIGPLDLMIASHAIAVGTVLVTNDLTEFMRVPGLRCEDWTR